MMADLLRHGLLNARFMPPLPPRDRRALTRHRPNLVQDRARVVNQLQTVLEWAHIKLTSGVTDRRGVSARAMRAALRGGAADQGVLADLAQGRVRAKHAALEQAVVGDGRAHHRCLLARPVIHSDFLDEAIACSQQAIETAIAPQPPLEPPPPSALEPADTAHERSREAPLPPTTPPLLAWAEAVARLDPAPGMGRPAAELIRAESGTDTRRLPPERQLARWAKVGPGNRQRGGQRSRSRTGTGQRWRRPSVVPAAGAAIRVQAAPLAAGYRRVGIRLGTPQARLAVAHRGFVATDPRLKDHVPERALGTAPLSEPTKQKRGARLQRQMEQRGCMVTLQPAQPV
jgi:transposase